MAKTPKTKLQEHPYLAAHLKFKQVLANPANERHWRQMQEKAIRFYVGIEQEKQRILAEGKADPRLHALNAEETALAQELEALVWELEHDDGFPAWALATTGIFAAPAGGPKEPWTWEQLTAFTLEEFIEHASPESPVRFLIPVQAIRLRVAPRAKDRLAADEVTEEEAGELRHHFLQEIADEVTPRAGEGHPVEEWSEKDKDRLAVEEWAEFDPAAALREGRYLTVEIDVNHPFEQIVADLAARWRVGQYQGWIATRKERLRLKTQEHDLEMRLASQRGETYKQIARREGLQPSTVKSAIARAKRAVGSQLIQEQRRARKLIGFNAATHKDTCKECLRLRPLGQMCDAALTFVGVGPDYSRERSIAPGDIDWQSSTAAAPRGESYDRRAKGGRVPPKRRPDDDD